MVLMEEYARNVPDELTKKRSAQIDKAGRNIYFAWSGGIKRDEPHYYRIQASSFLIELDDTQDDANHIHSVGARRPATSARIYSNSTMRPVIDER